jgi:hypothetical protein
MWWRIDIGVTNIFWSRSRHGHDEFGHGHGHGHGRDHRDRDRDSRSMSHENSTDFLSAVSFCRLCGYVLYR